MGKVQNCWKQPKYISCYLFILTLVNKCWKRVWIFVFGLNQDPTLWRNRIRIQTKKNIWILNPVYIQYTILSSYMSAIIINFHWICVLVYCAAQKYLQILKFCQTNASYLKLMYNKCSCVLNLLSCEHTELIKNLTLYWAN